MKWMIPFILTTSLQNLAVATANNQQTNYPAVGAKVIKETPLMTKEMKAKHPGTPVCHFARKDYDSPEIWISLSRWILC